MKTAFLVITSLVVAGLVFAAGLVVGHTAEHRLMDGELQAEHAGHLAAHRAEAAAEARLASAEAAVGEEAPAAGYVTGHRFWMEGCRVGTGAAAIACVEEHAALMLTDIGNGGDRGWMEVPRDVFDQVNFGWYCDQQAGECLPPVDASGIE